MDIYEIAGYTTGIERGGVNFLDPIDAFETISNGYIYRQELLSRKGIAIFSDGRLSDGSRVMGIFEHTLPNDFTELLAVSKEFLYKYNDVTNVFDQIPNNSSVPFVSFGISGNDDYVSGTSYPFADGSARFVFSSKGMSDTYMYDGTDVKRFTNVVDNPDYQAPAGFTLTNCTYILWFGERLNLCVPVLTGTAESQMVLYSGIRNVAGNGDKFNVVGSGNLSADTYEFMTGAVIAGDFIVLLFNRSTWTIEKTRDAFNPYFIRRVPGVLGTDAPFSFVTYGNRTESIGKTGILATDGRTSLRNDDKIPYFTADDIDQVEFNLTYGGFDRINTQYLFSYRNSDSELADLTQDKVLVNNYKEGTWAIFDLRLTVFGQTDKGINLSWDDIDETHNLSWEQWDTTEEIWNQIGIGESVQKTLAGDDMGFIYEMNKDYDDYFATISAITTASSAVVTVSESAFKIGDEVFFDSVEGMTQINGLTGTVTAASLTSITVSINSNTFTAYSGGGHVSKMINFSADLSPFNPYRSEGRKVRVSHIEFLINTNNGSLYLDIFEDEEQTPFKSNVLMQPVGSLKAREWVECSVDQEANFITFKMSQLSPSAQVVITSIRIHAERGGLTYA